MQLLEELSRPFRGIQSHPIHIVHSELYVLELLAECCSVHWASVNTSNAPARNEENSDEEVSDSGRSDSETEKHRTRTPDVDFGRQRRASRNLLLARNLPPGPLNDDLVRRVIEAVKTFCMPLPESCVLSSTKILDDAFLGLSVGGPFRPENTSFSNGHINGSDVSQLLLDTSDAIERYTGGIIEYVSFSNWHRVFEYLKSALQQSARQPAGSQTSFAVDDDRSPTVSLRLISSFWVDSRKLSLVIQELCGSFLHLRKSCQTTIAIALPLLITRWLERNPLEFIELHSTNKRLDGGAETLFDMSNTVFDSNKRKALQFPFQTSLLLLLPDVFAFASNMREVKSSSSVSKKVSFLEMLRKALRNRNEAAVYCLTSILRVTRHFPLDSDAALVSYALDVQEEVKDAVFRRQSTGMDAANIDRALMTAAFVSLTHLNFESSVENLTAICLAPSAPQDFKIAVISACSHFARQSNSDEYQPLFSKIADFIRAQLVVRITFQCIRNIH